MHLIFGGAYQGKLDYARERYHLGEDDVFFCCVEKQSDAAYGIDFSKKVVDGLELFILRCVQTGTEAKDELEETRDQWKDTVFICTDISSGVVPMEKERRAWREMVGRTLMYLGKEAEEVTRIFCGLPQKIK